MPDYEITSPDGKKFIITAPEGATQDEILSYAKTQFSSDGSQRMVDTQKDDSPEGYMAGLRMSNPGQAQVIDEMGTNDKLQIYNPFGENIETPIPLNAGVTKTLANIGAGFTDTYHGLPGTGANPDLELSNQLEKASGIPGTISRVVGQAAPFIPAALGASALPTFGSRVLGSAAVGGTEAGTVASGTGSTPLGVAGSALFGTVLGGAIEAASPFIMRAARALIQKVKGAPPAQPLFDDAGVPSQELTETLQQTGMTIDDLAAELPADQMTREFAGSGMENRLSQVANEVQVNPERARAAQEMNLNAPVATLSDQSSVQEIAGATLAAPGSKASEIFRQYTDDLTKSAEELVQRAGGDLDKGLVSDDLKRNMNVAIDDMKNYSNTLYKEIGEKVRPDTIVNANSNGTLFKIPLIQDILGKAKNAEKGISGLSTVYQDVFNKLKGRPTYFDLDNLRKDIGDSIGSQRGTYSTTPVAQLKEMYSKLTELQDSVINRVAPESLPVWNNAKRVDAKRYELQENSEFLFGDGNIGAVMPKVELSLKQLSKGNTKNFNEVVAALPESQKHRVMTSALDSVIRKTQVDGKSIDANGFTKWYGELSSSPTNKKALIDNLPEGVGKSLDNLYLLTQGLANVTKNKKSTGIVPETLKQIDKTDGLVAKLFNITDKAANAPIIGAAAGPSMRVVSNIAKMATKERTPAVTAADDLLSSPEFKSAVLASTKDQKIAKIAEAKLKQTKEYKNYIQNQNKTRAASIASTGLIPFLMQDDDE